ncbi:MAG: aldehyde ferredoxin oxidoreductase, partial [Candidatus Cloacimonetes bacterium]|nr:aldehyde ferredoxin oxidoreductase [Candidatus Cloacimonadota bacterium]
MKGMNNKILHVDLASGTSWMITPASADIENYIGGRGLAVKLFTDMSNSILDPLAPDNPLIFMNGPLTDTIMTSGRFQIISRS